MRRFKLRSRSRSPATPRSGREPELDPPAVAPGSGPLEKDAEEQMAEEVKSRMDEETETERRQECGRDAPGKNDVKVVEEKSEQSREAEKSKEEVDEKASGRGEQEVPKGPVPRLPPVTDDRVELQDKILETADAIDALLSDVMHVRRDTVDRFKKADRTMKKYQHASMYNKLNHLPTSKIDLYEQVCKLRTELKQEREQHERASKLLAGENRGLRRQLEETEGREAAACERAEIAQAEQRKLRAQHHKLSKTFERTKLELEHIREEERARRVELERTLRKEMQTLKEDSAKRLAAVKDERDKLEVQVDNFRGKVVNSQISLLELEYGLPT